jgi:GT2 family glycosyltransferase
MAVMYGAGLVTASAADVTFVVLNYNGRRFLEVVLPSIARQTLRGFSVKVIDDASTDESLSYLAKEWPNIAVVRSDRNLGVTASMARGIASVSTPFVALLNNDLELDQHWLEEMLAGLTSRPNAAAVDCKMLGYHDRSQIDGVGDILRRNGYPGRRGQGEHDGGQYDDPAEVFSVSGGAALYRREAFDLVGTYDSDFIAYYEDVDWGFRARLKGFAAWTVPSAVAYHMGSASTKRDPDAFTHLIVRNQVIVILKNFPGSLLLRCLPRILFFQVKWLLFDVLEGRAGSHVRGLSEALRMVPGAVRKRREIQRARVVSARSIESALQ